MDRAGRDQQGPDRVRRESVRRSKRRKDLEEERIIIVFYEQCLAPCTLRIQILFSLSFIIAHGRLRPPSQGKASYILAALEQKNE